MNNSTNNIVVTCEPITAELLEDVQHLYADEPFKAALWKWQFKPRFGQIPLCVVARDGQKIIGFNGTMPVLLVMGPEKIVPAIWSCDFIVEAAYRGHGVGGAIKNSLFGALPEPVMSLGISDSAYPLLIKKGGKSPVTLPVFHRVRSAINFKSLLFRIYSIVRALPNYWVIKKAVRNYQVEELSHLPDEKVVEHLWHIHMQSQLSVQVVRNHEYLQWRYEDYPGRLSADGAVCTKVYRYLSVSKKGSSVSGLIIFRISTSAVLEVVDFIGDLNSENGIFSVCHFLHRNFPHVIHISWNTSSSQVVLALTKFGFIRKSYSSRFIVFSDEALFQWNLTAGDSDGDFLRVAKEQFENTNENGIQIEREVKKNPIKVIGEFSWSDQFGNSFQLVNGLDGFLNLRDQWGKLLTKSNANPLFMAWGWQFSWWITWGDQLACKLSIVVIYSNEELIGLVPLYQYRDGLLKVFQFIGNAWGLKQTVRSEYISPLFNKENETQLTKSFELYFRRLGVNAALIIPDATSTVFPSLPNICLRRDVGYRLPTYTDFESYQRSLGSQTRLKAFGRRRQLLQQGEALELDFEYSNLKKVDIFFSKLNSFHLLRWGKPCFNRDAISFHKSVLAMHTDMIPSMSSLVIGKEVFSLSYNLVASSVLYNLQSGYVEHYDKKVSLGTLHMGWEIERCFNNQDIAAFDFLAGHGKVEDYKRHYRGEQVEFFTNKYFSSSLICFVFSVFVWFRAKIKLLAEALR
jgi:hypothetical protein